jgi:site-specific recombinase XerD
MKISPDAEAYRKARTKLRMHRLLFPNSADGYLSRRSFNRHVLAKLLPVAQSESRLDFSEHSLHDLRHTTVTLLLSEGESITRESRRLEHAAVTTTMNTYAHAAPQDESSPADRLEMRKALRKSLRETVQTDLEA